MSSGHTCGKTAVKLIQSSIFGSKFKQIGGIFQKYWFIKKKKAVYFTKIAVYFQKIAVYYKKIAVHSTKFSNIFHKF